MTGRLRHLRDAREAGLTLVELLISLVLTGLVLSLVVGLFVNISLGTSAAQRTRMAQGSAAVVVDELSKVIRASDQNPVSATVTDPGVVSGTGSALSVISWIDTSATAPAPTLVTFTLSATGDLVETRTAATRIITAGVGYWVFTGAVTTRTLPGPLTTGTTPLFQYVDASGALISPGAGLTLAQRGAVVAIKLAVTVTNTGRVGSDPMEIDTTIGMPNLNLNGSGT